MYCGISLFQKLRSQQGTALQMGGVLRYKLEVYWQCFLDKLYGLGAPKQLPLMLARHICSSNLQRSFVRSDGDGRIFMATPSPNGSLEATFGKISPVLSFFCKTETQHLFLFVSFQLSEEFQCFILSFLSSLFSLVFAFSPPQTSEKISDLLPERMSQWWTPIRRSSGIQRSGLDLNTGYSNLCFPNLFFSWFPACSSDVMRC